MLSNKTPFEALYKRPPTFLHLKVFGCKCYATVVHPKKKFEPRVIPCVFIGHPCGHKDYKLYDMQSKKFFIIRDVKFCEDDFLISSASQTLTLAPSTLILPLHDPSYSNIHSNSSTPSILSIPLSSPPPSIPSPNSSVPNSPDSPTKFNLIPPNTSVPLRRSTRIKQPPTCYNYYEMFSRANHLTSSSSPNTGTRYPLHRYLSFSRFSPAQRAFLALITAQTKPKIYDEVVGNPLWQQVMKDEIAALERNHT